MKGEIQTLPADHSPSWPFKSGPAGALRNLPMGHNPKYARVDAAHTWSIAGIGKDFCASTILLCARIGIFGQGSMEKCLNHAYNIFQSFLVKAGKYSSIDDFSHKTLKAGKSSLDSSQLVLYFSRLKPPYPKSMNSLTGITTFLRAWGKGTTLQLSGPG